VMDRKVLQELYERAVKSVENAYAPYSRFRVGAAVLMENDRGERRAFTGVNVENSSYGLTVCAERVAVFKGVSEGYRKLLALSLVAVKDGETLPVLPCGACRQVMWEFGNGDTPVYDGEKVYRLGDLLPGGFRLGKGRP